MNDDIALLFRELADLSPPEREEYFKQRNIPPDLRAEVESLLNFDAGDGPSLTHVLSAAAQDFLVSGSTPREGDRCGPYRLVRLLGRGGSGVVYAADRTDGALEQRVAVKLLRYGTGDAAFRERFVRERQILANLHHPGIVHLLDAGQTADGQLYLVMQYVEGVPIDVYARSLDLREKLNLFLRVCDAVSYTHRNLVVHRDIKPSNILVDSTGDPKLLDFGIAKILDEVSDRTQTQNRWLTPDYASPEQIRGEPQTTAVDIYALGAVLYRLLTGRSPHKFPDESGGAIEAAICTTEPAAASSLNPDLPKDLDFILIKALRKEPEERYISVDAFADDIRALLEFRPVRARSGNAWYRTRKLARRYWMTVAAATIVIASLSGGLYLANRQRIIAERRFAQLRQLAHQVLFDLDGQLGWLPGSINARLKLVQTSTQYLAGLRADALNNRALALEVAESYLQVARIQGVPAWNNLGQYAEAEESLRQADQLVDSVLATDPYNRNALWLAANAAHDHASVAMAAGRPEIVLASSPKVAGHFNQLVRLGNLSRREINGATYIYGDLAEDLICLHRFEDSVRYAKLGAAISLNSPFFGPRAQVFSQLALALMDLGDVPGSQNAMQEARSQMEKLRQRGDDGYVRYVFALVRKREAQILGEDGSVNLNRPEEAAAALQEAFDLIEQSARAEPKDYHARHDLAEIGRYLAEILRHRDPKRALAIYDHTLTRVREVPKDVAEGREEAALLASSSYAARWIHREKDARERIDTAFRLLRETKDYPVETIKLGSEADITLRALADHYAETGQPSQAVEAYQELRHKIIESNPGPQNDLVNAALISHLDASLASLLRRVGRTGEAVTLDENRLELWRHWNSKLPGNPFVLRQLKPE